MIPLKDSTRRQSFPFVNYGLIAANAFVFVLELLARHTLTGYLPVFGAGLLLVWFFPKRKALEPRAGSA